MMPHTLSESRFSAPEARARVNSAGRFVLRKGMKMERTRRRSRYVLREGIQTLGDNKRPATKMKPYLTLE